MNVSEKLFLASILTLSLAWPVRAQSPTQGDYYAPGPTIVVHPTEGQLKRNEQGDYYVGGQMILNKRRAEALKTCTHNKAFDSDAYVACAPEINWRQLLAHPSIFSAPLMNFQASGTTQRNF